MAFGVDGIAAVETWTAASYAADDGSLDVDVTVCMLNGTVAEDCDEWKEGTINGKIFIDHAPASILTLKIRFYLNSIMAAGDSSVLPYTDTDSVDNTNEVISAYDSAGQWVEHDLSAALIAQLADLGSQCALRWASNDAAKSKIGEVNIDITVFTFTFAGVTRDKDEAVLGSVEYTIFKRTGMAPEVWVVNKSGTSNGSGVYTEELATGTYRIVAVKDVEPQVMDIGPPAIASQATASDDVFALGIFHSLANDDRVFLYQAGVAALPGAISEDTLYHVVSQSGNTCKLSLTQGGAAINITADGDAWIVGEPVTS